MPRAMGLAASRIDSRAPSTLAWKPISMRFSGRRRDARKRPLRPPAAIGLRMRETESSSSGADSAIAAPRAHRAMPCTWQSMRVESLQAGKPAPFSLFKQSIAQSVPP